MERRIEIDGDSLDLQGIAQVARGGYTVAIAEHAKEKITRSRRMVEDLVDRGDVVYGITTGFGKFADVVISKSETRLLQKNLIVSHACGVGEFFDEPTVRAIMLLRANALAKGFSGIRLETIETLIHMINKGVHPIIPQKGSLGASGDLAPLAHMVLVMLGLGEAIYQGERMCGHAAMELANIPLIELEAKEGLALINGTQVLTAVGALAVYDAMELMKVADVCAALSMEAKRGIIDAFDHKIAHLKNYPGQQRSAANVRTLTKDSHRITKQGELHVQDPYSFRCASQVHGASRDAINYAHEKVLIEINSATDNPLVFTETGEVISGGNFHGQPMALAFDFLGIAIAELANISERRIEQLVNPTISNLPPFLTEHGGFNSGFMIVQYAAAALVSENKVLAHPASVDSIPSSGNQEDHVSMGTIAARKARSILDNATRVLGMELYCACQAIDLTKNGPLGVGTQIAYDTVRKSADFVDHDRVMYPMLNACADLITSGELLHNLEQDLTLC